MNQTESWTFFADPFDRLDQKINSFMNLESLVLILRKHMTWFAKKLSEKKIIWLIYYTINIKGSSDTAGY